MKELNEFFSEEKQNEHIVFNDFPLTMSTEMQLTGILTDRIDDLLINNVDYTEEGLTEVIRKIRTHIENTFNNLKYIVKKEDIAETSQMEKFTEDQKHRLKILFNKFSHTPLESIELYRFENQKYSYITSINKINKLYHDANVHSFIVAMDEYLKKISNINNNNIFKVSRNKKFDKNFKSNITLNNFLKDMYTKKEKTIDTLDKGSRLFKNVDELKKCIDQSLKFKNTYKESIKVHNIVQGIEQNLNILFDTLDNSKKLSKGEIKRVYSSLDMRMISNSLSLYGVLIELMMKIENNIILSTKKLIGALPI